MNQTAWLDYYGKDLSIGYGTYGIMESIWTNGRSKESR